MSRHSKSTGTARWSVFSSSRRGSSPSSSTIAALSHPRADSPRHLGRGHHVNFEQGLNFCIRQIRLALNDQAEHPRHIETIPRLGYRFISHPRSGRSAEDGSSRVPLPSGRTPRPFAIRVPRGLHSTPPTVRARPMPIVAGCSRAASERPLPKGLHLAARNPSAPPMPPHPTTLKPRPDSPACFAIANSSPAPRPPSELRSRQLTTFQVQGAGSTPRARHRSDADRAAMGWLVGHRRAPHRQDSLGLEFGMLRMSLSLVLPVDCVCGRTSRGVDRSILVRNDTGVMT